MLFNFEFGNQISLLSICSGLGQKQKGVELGPQILMANGFGDILRKDAQLNHLAELTPEQNEDTTGWNLMNRIRVKASEALQSKNLLFSIGGDHSISIGTVQATLKNYPTARVIWIDAHGDMNTPQTSTTGNLHGMPLAALLGLFKTPIGGPLLSSKKLLLVGVRDLDPAEKIFFEELSIEFISAEEALSDPNRALKKMSSWLKQDPESPIHLSFDVDALDPSVAPATGLRVPLGLSVEFAKRLLNLISLTQKVVSVDLVELNPLKVETQQDLAQTIQSLKSIFSAAHTHAKLNEIEM